MKNIRNKSVTFFFFNDTATTEIYTLSLHDALPIYPDHVRALSQEFVDAGSDVVQAFTVSPKFMFPCEIGRAHV